MVYLYKSEKLSELHVNVNGRKIAKLVVPEISTMKSIRERLVTFLNENAGEGGIVVPDGG